MFGLIVSVSSFPRSAWERPGRTLRVPDTTQSVGAMGSHGDRGNQTIRVIIASFASQDSAMSSVTSVPLLIGGRFESSASDRRGDVFNPSTGQVQAKVPFCTPDEIDKAVQAAVAALPAWCDT